jgi:hypothetical protein
VIRERIKLRSDLERGSHRKEGALHGSRSASFNSSTEG